MPTEERGEIGSVKPSGWKTIKYDIVDGKYLYNRCHLIGYQLTAENANERNLITGTRYMNVQGMLPFENMVVLVKMKGKDIKKLTDGSYNYTYTNTTLKDNQEYVVAVVDYVYYGKPYLFTNEISHIATDILMRDLLINYISDSRREILPTSA